MKVVQPRSEGSSRVEEVAVEPVEVIAVSVPSPVRSTSTEDRAEILAKPISGQAFAMSAEQRQEDHTSKSIQIERQPVIELRATDDSRLVETNPPISVSGGVDEEVGVDVEVTKEVVATSAQVCRIDDNNGCPPMTFVQGLHDMDVEPGRFDLVVARSPMKV